MLSMKVVKMWLPLGVTITILCGLVYGLSQYSLKMSANDPQIQMSEDLAKRLATGENPMLLMPTEIVNLNEGLGTFVIVFDETGQIMSSTARLDGKVRGVPMGVLDHAKRQGQNKVTWMPQPGLRFATVTTAFSGARNGTVLVGRSLRLIEARQRQIESYVLMGCLLALSSSFGLMWLGQERDPKGKKKR